MKGAILPAEGIADLSDVRYDSIQMVISRYQDGFVVVDRSD